MSSNTVDGAGLNACKRLLTSKDELLASDGAYLYGFSSQADAWVKHDKLPRALPRWSVVQQSPQDISDIQVAVGNGYTVFAWTQETPGGALGDVYAMVQDTASGTILLQSTVISNGAGNAGLPRLAVVGTICVAMWSDTAGKLVACLLDLTAPNLGFGSRVDVKTDQNVLTVFYDIVGTSGAFVGVYSDSAGTPLFKAFRCTVTLPATITVTHTVSSGDTNGVYTTPCCVYDAASGKVWVLYGASTPYPVPATFHVKAYAFTASTCAVSTAPFTIVSPTSQIIQAGVTFVSSTNIRGLYQTANGDGKAVELTNNNVLGNVPTLLMASRPFTDGTNAYVMIRYAQSHLLSVIEGTLGAAPNPLRPIATIAPRIAYPPVSLSSSGAGSLDQAPTQVWNVGGKHWRTYGTVIADANLNARVGITAVDINMDDGWLANGDIYPSQHQQGVEYGELLHLSGGVPSSFDGQFVSEMGFLHPPQANALTLVPASPGGGLGQGVYQYRICYEWTDNRGQIYRSEPSTAKSVTTAGVGAINKVTLTIPNLLLSTKRNVQIIVYRTLVNGDGSLFYRQTAYSVPLANINDSAQASTTIVDTTSDVVISGQALLYTNGGTLAAQNPPALGCLVKHQRRLAGIGDDGRTMWLSNEFVDREAPRWNDEYQVQFDAPLTALAGLDDKWIAFSEDQIWFFTGQGPTDTGAANDWTAPIEIQTETGCIDPRSVFNTSQGVMFQGRRGYYLLDRALNVTFVGALIEDTTKANPLAIESLGQVSGETSCYISLVPSSALTTGIRLHWDTFYKMWARDEIYDSDSELVFAIAGMVNWNGTIVVAQTDGTIYKQFSTDWRDEGFFYPSSFITGDISSGGPLGFQRVRFAQIDGTWLTNHDVKMSFAFDGDTNYAQSYQWTASKLVPGEPVKMRVGAQNGASPRCSGLRIKVEILTPTNPGSYPQTTGQSATLSGIGLEIVPKPGQKKLGAAVQA
jgi:hypothetical protein